MRAIKTIHLTAVILWFISAVYLIYKYSLDAGYWEHPLYITLLFYFIIIISKKGFYKLNLCIFFFYIGFSIWVFMDLFLAMGEVFSVD